MTRYEQLKIDIENSEIQYYDVDSTLIPADSLRDMDGEYAIFFNESAFKRATERYVALSHEIGHCVTGAVYSAYSPLETRERCEYRADNYTIMQLVPFDELDDAIKRHNYIGGVDWQGVADCFNVTVEFLQKAIERYRVHGKMLVQEEA